jgi:RNA polymerase primary sigma factor
VNTMDRYMTEIVRHSLLDAEEEVALAIQLERGRQAEHQLAEMPASDTQVRQQLEAEVKRGEKARRRLIVCNLRLVISVAKHYLNCGLPLSDLVQEGNVGLMEAVERYDHRRGLRFSTYAMWWIRQAIQRAVANHGRVIRLPARVNDELYRLRQAERSLESRLERLPTLQELAERMGMSLREVRRLVKWDRRTLSLDMPVGDEGDSHLRDFVQDQDTPPTEDIVARHQLRQVVQEVLDARLRPREQEVLRMRFGLDGSEGLTLKQVAQKLGITRERVRQIEARALRRLRHVHTWHQLKEAWV